MKFAVSFIFIFTAMRLTDDDKMRQKWGKFGCDHFKCIFESLSQASKVKNSGHKIFLIP